MTLNLGPIPPSARKTERLLFEEFDRIAPGCLGSLLDAVSCALARKATIQIDSPPRLADFTAFVAAAEAALGWSEGTFVRTYKENLRISTQSALDADPITAAIRTLLDRRSYWSGTATQLLEVLADCVPEDVRRSKRWPSLSNQLTNRLRRVTPALRTVGIDVLEKRSATAREIMLQKTSPKGVSDEDAGNG